MEAKSLIILGAGGHGKVVGDIASLTAPYSDIVFLDDQFPDLRDVGPWRIAGTLETVFGYSPMQADVFVAIGLPAVRMKWLIGLQAAGFALPAVIHGSASVSPLATVAPGSVVVAQAAINADARIERGCIINTGATVGHDCVVDEGAHVAPGANLAGNVRVGMRSWIGIGAVVLQGVSIGQDVIVGAGTVVLKDLRDGVTAVGNPARIIKCRQ